MEKKVVILPGDGIGQEVVIQAERVLKSVASRFDIKLETESTPIGGTAYDLTGSPHPDFEICKKADAILLGAVGGTQWEGLDYSVRPERGLLKLRSELDLFANLRPAVVYGELASASSLKQELVEGVDFMVVRELTGGIYFGEPRAHKKTEDGKRYAYNTMIYNEDEIRRIAKVSYEIAKLRGGKLCSIDKANVLQVSELWRDVVTEVGKDYPEVELSHMYVDNAAMQVVRAPKQFDTVVTGNLFGDIISDCAAMVTGSLGMLPSASVGSGRTPSVYEPVHGSAPDIAGKDLANPLATILSVGMMFQYSFKMPAANQVIKNAVMKTIETYRTGDIMAEGKQKIGCIEMGDRVLEALKLV